jgi:hypothetical protein
VAAALAVGLLLLATLGRGSGRSVRFASQMTVEEFSRCGLPKLTPAELANLESWIERGVTTSPRGLGLRDTGGPADEPVPGDPAPVPTEAAGDGRRVAFNTSSRKYHCPSCPWALKCTRNCIEVTLAEAIERGGVACKVWGGRCR